MLDTSLCTIPRNIFQSLFSSQHHKGKGFMNNLGNISYSPPDFFLVLFFSWLRPRLPLLDEPLELELDDLDELELPDELLPDDEDLDLKK